MNRTIALIFVLEFLAGCSISATGIVRSSGDRLAASFGPGVGKSEMKITLPDGEIFTGMTVATGSSAGMFQSAPPQISPFGGVEYSSDMTSAGVLTGNRGHIMWCSFQAVGFGVEGVCDTSDGNIIDISK